jgi:DNA-directed RNA polymerase specialized sigma24 family protein
VSTKNEIISELYKSREFNDCIGRMEPEHLRDDLKAEVMLALLEKDDQFIIDIHFRGELKFFTTRIILNLIKSNTSPFYKKYRMTHSSLDTTYKEPIALVVISKLGPTASPESEISDRLRRELEEDKVKQYIKTLYWYDREIVELYIKLGNYRAIEKETGIPFESCYSTVKKVIKKIRQDVLTPQ